MSASLSVCLYVCVSRVRCHPLKVYSVCKYVKFSLSVCTSDFPLQIYPKAAWIKYFRHVCHIFVWICPSTENWEASPCMRAAARVFGCVAPWNSSISEWPEPYNRSKYSTVCTFQMLDFSLYRIRRIFKKIFFLQEIFP